MLKARNLRNVKINEMFSLILGGEQSYIIIREPHTIYVRRKSDVCIDDPENNRDCFCDLRMFSGNHWFRCV